MPNNKIHLSDSLSPDKIQALVAHYLNHTPTSEHFCIASKDSRAKFANKLAGMIRNRQSPKTHARAYKLFVPILLQHNHWVLLSFFYQKYSSEVNILYFDPAGNSISNSLKKYLLKRFPQATINYHTLSKVVQNESSSESSVEMLSSSCCCDLWILEVLLALNKDTSIPTVLDYNAVYTKHHNNYTISRMGSEYELLKHFSEHADFFIAPYIHQQIFKNFIHSTAQQNELWYENFNQATAILKQLFTMRNMPALHNLYRIALLGVNESTGLKVGDLSFLKLFIELLDERELFHKFYSLTYSLKVENVRVNWKHFKHCYDEILIHLERCKNQLKSDDKKLINKIFYDQLYLFVPQKHMQYAKQSFLLLLFIDFYKKMLNRRSVKQANRIPLLARAKTVSHNLVSPVKKKIMPLKRKQRSDSDLIHESLKRHKQKETIKISSNIHRLSLVSNTFTHLGKHGNKKLDLASVLQKPKIQLIRNELANDDIVTTCLGHLADEEEIEVQAYMQLFSKSPNDTSTLEEDQCTLEILSDNEENEIKINYSNNSYNNT